MRSSRNSRSSGIALLCAVLSVAGCNFYGSSRSAGCSTPDKALVDAVMAHAKSNFRFGVSGSMIDHLEFVRAAKVALPLDVQGEGAVSVLGVRTGDYLANPVSSAFAVVEATSLFLLDASGAVIGPISTFAPALFTYPTPKASGWAALSARVEKSAAVDKVSICVDPYS